MWGYSLWFRKSLQFKHPLNLVLLLFLSRRDKKNWGAKSMETLLSKQMQLSSFTYTHKKNAKLQFWKELSVFKRTCMLKDLTQKRLVQFFPTFLRTWCACMQSKFTVIVLEATQCCCFFPSFISSAVPLFQFFLLCLVHFVSSHLSVTTEFSNHLDKERSKISYSYKEANLTLVIQYA